MSKILMIAGCSKKKAEYKTKVRNLFKGQLFKMILKLSQYNNYDMKVISGKHGILNLNDVIGPYDQKIKTKKDIARIKEMITPELIELYPKYDKIIILLGKNYREAINPIIDQKSFVIFDKRGLMGYLSIVSKLLKSKKGQILKEIKKYQKVVCFYASCNEEKPNNCYFCKYYGENKCNWNKTNNYLKN